MPGLSRTFTFANLLEEPGFVPETTPSAASEDEMDSASGNEAESVSDDAMDVDDVAELLSTQKEEKKPLVEEPTSPSSVDDSKAPQCKNLPRRRLSWQLGGLKSDFEAAWEMIEAARAKASTPPSPTEPDMSIETNERALGIMQELGVKIRDYGNPALVIEDQSEEL